MAINLPAAIVIPRHGERLIAMQVAKDDKERIREYADDPVLVICKERYHHGELGMFKPNNVYAVPKILFTELKKRKGKRWNKLAPCTKEQAKAQLKSNLEAAKKERARLYKERTGIELPPEDELDGPIGVDSVDEYGEDAKGGRGKGGSKKTESPENKSAESPETK